MYNCSAENDFGTDHVMVSLTKQSESYSIPKLHLLLSCSLSVTSCQSEDLHPVFCCDDRLTHRFSV